MNRNMLTSFLWCMHIIALPTLTKSQAADPSHVTQWRNEASSVHIPGTIQTGGPSGGAADRPVLVRCHPDSWEIVVQADLFNTGLMVEGRHLRLGEEQRRDPGPCRAVPSGPAQFTVQAQLLDCGTVKHPATEERIIYSNVLVYSPEPSADGLLRLDGATIPVECHYDKLYSVKALNLLPTWASFVLRTFAESRMDFNLKLMTGDWKFQRESNVYYIGEPVHFEASSILGDHKPLRVFVDHCVATVSPDSEAALRYDFIEHGCLADAYLTNSSARFLSRTEDHRIRFHLDAFRFYQENANQIYITCHLTAVLSTVNAGSKHRACSFIDHRWRSADGKDEDCSSCSIQYSSRAQNRAKSEQSRSSKGLGRNAPKPQPTSFQRVHQSNQNVHTTHQSAVGLMREGDKRKGTLGLGPLIIVGTPRPSN